MFEYFRSFPCIAPSSHSTRIPIPIPKPILIPSNQFKSLLSRGQCQCHSKKAICVKLKSIKRQTQTQLAFVTFISRCMHWPHDVWVMSEWYGGIELFRSRFKVRYSWNWFIHQSRSQVKYAKQHKPVACDNWDINRWPSGWFPCCSSMQNLFEIKSSNMHWGNKKVLNQ